MTARWYADRYRERTYRAVRLALEGRGAWVVVSYSMRDDDTWDVITHCQSRAEALDYIDEVVDRNRKLVEADPLCRPTYSQAPRGSMG